MASTTPSFELAGKRIWVAGHSGMVGSSIVRRLQSENCEVLTISKSDLDLRDATKTREWVNTAKPDVIFVAAARVGGILANDTYPVDFLYDNLMIETNVMGAAFHANIPKLVFLASSCVYPKFAQQPVPEEALLTGALEPTNEWYSIAKIAGIKLGQAFRKQYGCDFISVVPTNLFGPGDNFDLDTSHVIPALIRKMHNAMVNCDSRVTVWGTGTPRREFMYVDDCADACIFLLKNYSAAQQVNVGTGNDVEINELANLVRDVVGYTGTIEHDLTKPDGAPRKLMNADKLGCLGWQPRVQLRDGLLQTYQWFLAREQRRASTTE